MLVCKLHALDGRDVAVLLDQSWTAPGGSLPAVPGEPQILDTSEAGSSRGLGRSSPGAADTEA